MAFPEPPQLGHTRDVLIAGAGIIGLSLALELRRRGASVTVIDRQAAFGAASSAAAGMLAAEDPHNPAQLILLSRYSLSLYTAFLDRVQSLSGQAVPYQTQTTVQYTESGSYELPERSVDPRQLGGALLAAAHAAGVEIVEHTSLLHTANLPAAIQCHTSRGEMRAEALVHTTGAWTLHRDALPLAPRKGQMLRVAMPAAALRQVHRAEHVYVVPRTAGPHAGSVLVGATVEDAGFDLSTHPAQLARLCEYAAQLSPATAFVSDAALLESWAGSRPYTPDLLPMLGSLNGPGSREWVASGHFRNGVLLAPGTALVLADLLTGHHAAVDLGSFSPSRFQGREAQPPPPIFDQPSVTTPNGIFDNRCR